MRRASSFRDLAWLVERPIAHRGLHHRSAGRVENTASAFAAAIAAGYPIECDLQLARDGEAVVFHDETLDRLTEATGRVIDRTADELQRIPIRDSADRIQTLSELLRQVSGRVPLVIELKSHWDGSKRLAERVVEVLSGYRGRFALMSFDPDLIAAVADLDPDIPRGIVADRVTDREYRLLPFRRRLELRNLGHIARSRPHFISYHARGLPYGAPRILRQLGIPIICYTIRGKTEASRALRYCDQITFEGYLP